MQKTPFFILPFNENKCFTNVDYTLSPSRSRMQQNTHFVLFDVHISEEKKKSRLVRVNFFYLTVIDLIKKESLMSYFFHNLRLAYDGHR